MCNVWYWKGLATNSDIETMHKVASVVCFGLHIAHAFQCVTSSSHFHWREWKKSEPVLLLAPFLHFCCSFSIEHFWAKHQVRLKCFVCIDRIKDDCIYSKYLLWLLIRIGLAWLFYKKFFLGHSIKELLHNDTFFDDIFSGTFFWFVC